ncbi:hypothetical protein NG788_00990 [Aliarcobacter cryaerophilus]|uniref:hypothetical protein n=1 Tax=Aliarcobacter cryaerophilus TaxID=28198 RepID=UPI003DA5A25F
MSSKKILKIVLGLSFFVAILIGGVNYIVDPLWMFDHSNKFNQKQDGFDERQQKTNYIYFKSKGYFDGILLGSSRATFVNQNDFKNMNIFNYSSSSMQPFEYKGYIDFAKKIKGKDLKYIIIGSDFYGTNIPKDIKFENPEFYIGNTLNFAYKSVLSVDAIYKSIKNIKFSLFGTSMYYDRENIKYQDKVSEDERNIRYAINIKRHTLELSYPKYKYNDEYINILKTIKNENLNSKFIIYTSAVTSDLLVSIIKNGKRWEDYKRWLHELVEVFGEVNHFMTINSITKNLENYPDDDHAYPSVLKLLANKLSNVENKNIPEDFGVLLTKDNIDEHLENLRKQIEEYDLNKSILD